MKKTSLAFISALISIHGALAGEAEKLCTHKTDDYAESVSFDAESKTLEMTYEMADGSRFSEKFPASYAAFSKESIPAGEWKLRIQLFLEGASLPIALDGAYRIEKIGNDNIDGLGSELWKITSQNGQVIQVLATIGMGEYYVCP